MDPGSEKIPGRQPFGSADQQRVAAYFESIATYWHEIYERRDVFSLIHQQRSALVLDWLDQLALPAGSRILEVGCGAGLLTLALAQRGYSVAAMDTAEAMVGLTRARVAQAGLGHRAVLSVGDAHSLAFPDNHFPLAVAIGVIPWLHAPGRAALELARVLQPGGHLIINADNRWRLHFLLDPAKSTLLAPARRALKRILRREPRPDKAGPSWARMHSIREFDSLLASAGLRKIKGMTLGFGPFSFFAWNVLPSAWELAFHRKLQNLADREFPLLRWLGAQYVVLARNPGNRRDPKEASSVTRRQAQG